MYVTRPLSELLKSAALVAAAPDGPNSGYLVIQDDDSLTYSCFGCCKNSLLRELPFPQDKELTVGYTTRSNDSTDVFLNPFFLIPALNHPLSSNRYYAILQHGKRKGEALTCSREEEKGSCCFCRRIKDVKPRPLDPNNIYQQFEIRPRRGGSSRKGEFEANSIASDGFPPKFLRLKGWAIFTKTPHHFKLDAAVRGLDFHLRARLPELDSTAPRVVGKWYTPFVFVKERRLRDQVKRSMYYEITLEQRWDQIYSCRRNEGNTVVIDTTLETEQVFVGGSRARWHERSAVDGVIWFKVDGGGGGVGLRVELVERMKWEERRGGWMGGDGEERDVRIHRVNNFGGGGGWNEFGCYVLVERFNLRRMDGSLVMSYDFKHLHQLRTKWD